MVFKETLTPPVPGTDQILFIPYKILYIDGCIYIMVRILPQSGQILVDDDLPQPS